MRVLLIFSNNSNTPAHFMHNHAPQSHFPASPPVSLCIHTPRLCNYLAWDSNQSKKVRDSSGFVSGRTTDY
jgi:hypothetical protein